MSQAQPLSGWWWSWMWAPPTEHSGSLLQPWWALQRHHKRWYCPFPAYLHPNSRGTKEDCQTLVEWRQAREHTHSPKYSCVHIATCAVPRLAPNHSPRQDVCPFSLNTNDQAVNILANRDAYYFTTSHLSFSYHPAVQSMRHVSQRLNDSPNWLANKWTLAECEPRQYSTRTRLYIYILLVYLLIYFWLCWMRFSLFAVSWGCSSWGLSWMQFWKNLIAVTPLAQKLSSSDAGSCLQPWLNCSEAWGIFLNKVEPMYPALTGSFYSLHHQMLLILTPISHPYLLFILVSSKCNNNTLQ